MNACYLCQKILTNTNSDTIEIIIEDGKTICDPCNQIKIFFSDPPVKKISKQLLQPKVKKEIKNLYICIKCKSSYEGINCSNCGLLNPLFNRKSKKK